MSPEHETALTTNAPADEVAALCAALWAKQVVARRRAVRALARLGPEAEEAIPALIAAFRDDDLGVRSGAVKALARMEGAAVGALIEALRQDDPDVRKVAVVCLGKIGPPAAPAVEPLQEMLADDWLAACAAEALGKIQGQGRNDHWARHLAAWLALAWAVLAVIGATAFALSWVGAWQLGPAGTGAIAAGTIMGGVGALLGGILGLSRGSVRAAVLAPLVLGLGGSIAGLLLGVVMGALIAPVVNVLGPR
jgi:hypothetical protein